MATQAACDLDVHRKAHALVLGTYQMTKAFPREEVFGLTSQLRRAMVSVPANISEGFAKRSRADKLRFYNIAQGSLEEARYYFQLAHDLGYADTRTLAADALAVGRMLGAYVARIESDRRRFLPLFLLLASCFLLLVGGTPTSAAAAPSQEDVFRSIQTNVGGGGVDTSKFLPILLSVIGFVLLLVVAGQRRKRVVVPKALNHQGKLLREVLKAVPLRAHEVKQLKVLAEHADADEPLASPLTLLLCPSLMARTIESKRLKVDRRALASVARKAGLRVTQK